MQILACWFMHPSIPLNSLEPLRNGVFQDIPFDCYNQPPFEETESWRSQKHIKIRGQFRAITSTLFQILVLCSDLAGYDSKEARSQADLAAMCDSWMVVSDEWMGQKRVSFHFSYCGQTLQTGNNKVERDELLSTQKQRENRLWGKGCAHTLWLCIGAGFFFSYLLSIPSFRSYFKTTVLFFKIFLFFRYFLQTPVTKGEVRCPSEPFIIFSSIFSPVCMYWLEPEVSTS